MFLTIAAAAATTSRCDIIALIDVVNIIIIVSSTGSRIIVFNVRRDNTKRGSFF